jgi:hypothetical protein
MTSGLISCPTTAAAPVSTPGQMDKVAERFNGDRDNVTGNCFVFVDGTSSSDIFSGSSAALSCRTIGGAVSRRYDDVLLIRSGATIKPRRARGSSAPTASSATKHGVAPRRNRGLKQHVSIPHRQKCAETLPHSFYHGISAMSQQYQITSWTVDGGGGTSGVASTLGHYQPTRCRCSDRRRTRSSARILGQATTLRTEDARCYASHDRTRKSPLLAQCFAEFQLELQSSLVAPTWSDVIRPRSSSVRRSKSLFHWARHALFPDCASPESSVGSIQTNTARPRQITAPGRYPHPASASLTAR